MINNLEVIVKKHQFVYIDVFLIVAIIKLGSGSVYIFKVFSKQNSKIIDDLSSDKKKYLKALLGRDYNNVYQDKFNLYALIFKYIYI